MRTIYVDTSVFGGKFDDEFDEWSDRFFQRVIGSEIELIISEVTISELEKAPPFVRKFIDSIPSGNILEVNLDEEAVKLGQLYISEGVVGKSSLADCFHIALATLNKADLLVSWNFRHIVNIQRIQGFNSVNLKYGYTTLEIRNPREAFDYESEG
jgi:predicted nucleic acid-binding protein